MVVLLHLAFFIFINIKGKDIIVGALKKSLGTETSLDSLSVKFPFLVEMKNFKCGNITFKKGDVLLGLSDPFKSLVINKIYLDGLNIKITREKEGFKLEPFLRGAPQPSQTAAAQPAPEAISPQQAEGAIPQAQVRVMPPVSKPVAAKSIPLTIRNIYVKNSSLEFIDLTNPKALRFILEGINARLRNFSYPDLAKFFINLKASLSTDKGSAKESLNINGWIDYLNKDMNLDFSLDSVDYFMFSNYYPHFWQPENLGLKEAALSLKLNFNSVKNNLVVDGLLSVEKISFIGSEEKTTKEDFIKTVIALLQGNKDKASLHFKLVTKMDSPAFDLSPLKKSFQSSVPIIGAEVIKEETIEKAKEGIEQIKGITKDVTTESVGKAMDAIKTVIDVFSTNPEPQKTDTKDQTNTQPADAQIEKQPDSLSVPQGQESPK
jgi:hypothetical protein